MTVGNAQAGAGLSADKMEKRDAPSASEPLSSATRVRTTSAEGGDRASAGSEAFTGAPGAGGGAAGGSRLPLRPSQPQANAAGGLRSVASLLPRARDIVARVTLRTDLGVRLTVDSAGRVRVEVDLPQEDGDLAPALRRALTSGLPLDAQRGDTLVIVTP